LPRSGGRSERGYLLRLDIAAAVGDGFPEHLLLTHQRIDPRMQVTCRRDRRRSGYDPVRCRRTGSRGEGDRPTGDGTRSGCEGEDPCSSGSHRPAFLIRMPVQFSVGGRH
jgi:hypothetical protein